MIICKASPHIFRQPLQKSKTELFLFEISNLEEGSRFHLIWDPELDPGFVLFCFCFPSVQNGVRAKRYAWGGGGGPAACCFKASKQVRLVERKVCFISDAGNWRGRWKVTDICPPTHKERVRTFIDRVWGDGYMQKQHSHL